LSLYINILVVIFGLIVGSFLNVCISRLPRGRSIVRPRSRCPKCGQPISAFDNIPVLSFIILKGRCRSCHERISPQYPIVEITSSLLLLLAYRKFGLTLQFAGYGYFMLALLVIFATDAMERVIPDRVTYPSIVIGLAFSALNREIVSGLTGAAAGFALLLLVAWFGRFLFRKEAMGGGDVKLAAMIGAFLGWRMLLVSLFLAFFTGALVGVVIMLVRGRGKGSEVAFGPFMAVGAVAALLFGETILQAYLRFLGR
jgi:leader peptidase (prepilin peptidase)/N-methyltransferase